MVLAEKAVRTQRTRRLASAALTAVLLLGASACTTARGGRVGRFVTVQGVHQELQILDDSTFVFRTQFSPESYSRGEWTRASPTRLVLRSEVQRLDAVPAVVQVRDGSSPPPDSTRISVRMPGAASAQMSEYVSFDVRTSRGGRAASSLSGTVAVPRVHPGDSLRVTLTLDDTRLVPKAAANPVATRWLHVPPGDTGALVVSIGEGTDLFQYRVVAGDTLHATRRGWRWNGADFVAARPRE